MKRNWFGLGGSSLLMALYLYAATGITERELFPVLFGILLWSVLHLKWKWEDKWMAAGAALLAVYLSFALYMGRQSWKINPDGFFTGKNVLFSLLGVPYIWIVFMHLGNWWKLRTFIGKEEKTEGKPVKREKLVWPLLTAAIVGCWLPALMCNYPGIIISDYVWQYNQASGADPLGSLHPLIHTALIAVSQQLCKLLFGAIMPGKAVLLNSLIQMVVLAAIVAFILTKCWKMTKNKYIRGLLVMAGIWYAFFPMNALFSIYMTKDVLFSAFVLLWSFQITENLKQKKMRSAGAVGATVTAILVLLFRSNGFLIVFGTLALLILFKRNLSWPKGMLLVLFLVFAVQTPIQRSLGIPKAGIAESIGMPINQIANIIEKGEPLSEDAQSAIEAVMPLESIKEKYHIRYVDYIKFAPEFNSAAIEVNKGHYLKLWLRLLAKYPADCIEASLNLTVGYWYPGVEKGCISYDYDSKNSFYEELGIKHYSSSQAYKHFMSPDVRMNVFEAWMWSPGLAVMLMLVLLFFCISQETYGLLPMFLPGLFGWGSLLLATPSYCETRYVYFIFLLLPVWCVKLWMAKEETQREKAVESRADLP